MRKKIVTLTFAKKIRMRYLIGGLFALLSMTFVQAQTTTNCLEIESILVAACGQPEGYNEMVRILTGPNPVNTNNLNVVWATTQNPFNGFVQNPATSILVNSINASITSCGYILQPVNGIIPANKKAIIVTSHLMNPTYNSFANLTDTLYILFHNNSTTTTGHFANNNGSPGLRTTTITYQGCTESVTYERNNLSNSQGASVSFTQSGTPSYYNNGCAAPVTQATVNASFVGAPSTLCPGSSINMTATVNSANFIGWLENGAGSFANPNTINATYNSSNSDNGTIHFYALAKTTCGDTIRDTISIQTKVRGTFAISPAANLLSLCPGQTLSLSVTPGTYTQGPIWSTMAQGNSITVTTPGTYMVGANDGCYLYADTVVVNAGVAPSVTVTPANGQICTGQSIQVSASNVSGTLSWSNGQTGTSFQATASGSYIATASNSCGTAKDTAIITLTNTPSVQITNTQTEICPNQPLQINATATSGTISWNTGATGNSINITAPGTYTATATNNCGTHQASITLAAGISPSVQLNIDQDTICAGTNINLVASNVVGILTWNTGATSNSISVSSTGTYTATATNGCGTANDQAIITALTAPSVQIQGAQQQTLCAGMSLNLVSIPSANSTLVTWSNASNAPAISVTQSGIYTVTVQNDCGTASQSVEVIQLQAPVAQINTNGATTFCEGGSVVLTGSGDGTYSWSNGSSSSSITATQQGNYSLTVTNECGTNTATVYVTVNGPIADFNIDGQLNTPTTINYLNQSTGADSYLWSLANGDMSTAENPTQSFNTGGDFLITLWVTDINGCKDSISKNLHITEPFNFYLPNVFTPNGDSINDVFLVTATGITYFRMSIFNRWGELIHESKDIYQGWDGKTVTGQMAHAGVYVVVIDYTTASGKDERKEGHVTLIK